MHRHYHIGVPLDCEIRKLVKIKHITKYVWNYNRMYFEERINNEFD